ncbi:DUF2957 domain-containing protein [Cupriavidus metallidurans]|uniref:DUF2957 domain-containing protein n=1 Tax=Cupriavidus metallidurans TaxID=119219 RepID=UPI0016456116|nr:DUF2957 domain-containing protein [Cupriavidus metallidurans]
MQMSHARHAFFAVAGVSLTMTLAACGGGGDGDASSSATPAAAAQQCATVGNCPTSGATENQPVASLCPSTLDYGTTYTGGSGAGEFLKMQFDSTKGTYQITIIESAVPKAPGSVSPTRAGVTLTGTMTHPTRPLPTAAQNNCAYELKTATASDGASQAIIDPANPPIIFIGNGVAGGGIPGATIQYGGLLGLGKIPQRTFPMYPVLAFAQTETDFSKVAGTYNLLGYHLVPSGGKLTGATNYAPATANTVETLNADGSCAPASGGSCLSTGQPWHLRAGNDGAFGSDNDGGAGSQPYPHFYANALAPANARARGVLVVGKLEGKQVPLLVRVGYAYINGLDIRVDDESGLALMTPTSTVTQASMQGSYIGSGSDFKYLSSTVQNNLVALIDPQDPSLKPVGGFQMDFTQATRPGVVATVDNSGVTGSVVTTGPVYAHLFGPAADPTFRVSALASR